MKLKFDPQEAKKLIKKAYTDYGTIEFDLRVVKDLANKLEESVIEGYYDDAYEHIAHTHDMLIEIEKYLRENDEYPPKEKRQPYIINEDPTKE